MPSKKNKNKCTSRHFLWASGMRRRVMWVPCAWCVFPFSSECTLLGPFPLPLHLNCFQWTLWWTTQSLRGRTHPQLLKTVPEDSLRQRPFSHCIGCGVTLLKIMLLSGAAHFQWLVNKNINQITSSQSRMTVKGSSPWGLRYDCITAQLLPLLPASFPSLPQTVIPKAFPN